MAYKFTLRTLRGVAIGELPAASGKRVGIPIKANATATVSVRLDHDAADTLLEGDTLLEVRELDDTTGLPVAPAPLFHGRQDTAEEVGGEDGGSVVATFSDLFAPLDRRLVGKSSTGYTRGDALNLVDRGQIVTELLNATNAESPSGLRIGTVTPTSGTFIGPTPWFYKPLSEVVVELGSTLDGYDWRVRPIRFTPAAGAGSLGYVGELDIAPVIGQSRPDAAFEFGDGLLNVKTYRRPVTAQGRVNRVFHLPPGFPDNAAQIPLTREDTGAQTNVGLFETVVPGDLTSDDLRGKLLDYHLAVRKGLRQTITIEPVSSLSGTVPVYGRDYTVGDIVPFRAWRNGVKRIDVLLRIRQVELAIDPSGAATFGLTMVPS